MKIEEAIVYLLATSQHGMKTEPGVTIASLAKTIGINTSAIQKHLKSMTDKGYIARREKDGQWDVFIIPSI